jgi:hypothetical protein
MDVEGIEHEITGLTRAIDRLGNGNAATDIGAVEGLSMQVRDGFALLAESIERGLSGLADAVIEAAKADES